MDDINTYQSWLVQESELLLGWLDKYILQWVALAQVALISLFFYVAFNLAKSSADWVKQKFPRRSYNSYLRFNLPSQNAFFLLYASALLWLVSLVGEGAQMPYRVVEIAAKLTLAWTVIRLTSSTIASDFWSKLIAIVLWVIAALGLLGLLDKTVKLLQKAEIKIGDFELSLFMIVKGAMTFGILWWLTMLLTDLSARGFRAARGLNPSQKVLFSKVTNILLMITAGAIGLDIVGIDLGALAVFSGALGLGIGFGLQKVFANLISGIILLLDHSIKPGDIIGVGDSFGHVHSLGARCVSVMTRDGLEHLIPNENLIAQEVVNWSYSSKKVRIHIPVGVSYKSDIRLVRDLIERVAKKHPRILQDPEPFVALAGYGDSSVNFDLRVWVDDPEEGLATVKTDVYFELWDLFKENNIEIPFPQRDTHIKIDPIMLEMVMRKILDEKAAMANVQAADAAK